jgi:cytochrome c553
MASTETNELNQSVEQLRTQLRADLKAAGERRKAANQELKDASAQLNALMVQAHELDLIPSAEIPALAGVAPSRLYQLLKAAKEGTSPKPETD